MSIKIMTLVWDFRKLKSTEKLVLLALADHANDEGECYPSLSKIAKKCGMSKQGVINIIDHAIHAKWLKKEKRFRQDNKLCFTSNFYTFFLENLKDKEEEVKTVYHVSAVDYSSQHGLSGIVDEIDNPSQHGLSLESSLKHQIKPSLNHDEKTANNIAQYLFSKIKTINPNFKNPNIQVWAKDIELAMLVDGRTAQQLKQCIDWIYTNPAGIFWQKNILSGAKLRAKFDTMYMQAQSSVTKKATLVDIYASGTTATELLRRAGGVR